MNIQEDFEEFLKLLNKKKVEYLVVGGYAVAFHGYVRATKDLDILFHNSPENIKRLKQVLNEFGFPVENLGDVVKILVTSSKPMPFGVAIWGNEFATRGLVPVEENVKVMVINDNLAFARFDIFQGINEVMLYLS